LWPGKCPVDLIIHSHQNQNSALSHVLYRSNLKKLDHLRLASASLSTEGQVPRDILFRYRKQLLLGELLHKMGVISEDELNEALQEQKKSGEKLGQILVKKGILTW
jgi:hypothetical protein